MGQKLLALVCYASERDVLYFTSHSGAGDVFYGPKYKNEHLTAFFEIEFLAFIKGRIRANAQTSNTSNTSNTSKQRKGVCYRDYGVHVGADCIGWLYSHCSFGLPSAQPI